MTRKDYILIAAALRDARLFPKNPKDANESAILALADYLKSDNGRFDKDRFIEAARKP